MQYDLIFKSEKVFSKFENLNSQQKILVIAAYLYRQFRLIKAFDQVYSEKLSELFISALGAAVDNASGLIKRTQEEVEANIPDTDEFSEQEGSFAQNLMISLNYFLLFVMHLDYSDLDRCVNMFLQNIDLLNYEADESYDEGQIILAEIEVALSLVEQVPVAIRNNYTNIEAVKLLARQHLV
ncbi:MULTISPECIES: hypothetical protein [Pseudomonas]|uniref:hypothetical protein n=1 Tax=Pseudomonas TaxID=286 RepID=UPI001AE585BC|nr:MULTISPECIES: hypothetical protein [unclassified Pseudomonas]MBP1127144.1 hypothetical protein [Pseudomonas sp. PvP025]MDQ0401004.1 hypothetical protein [Pseudomonas sp. PvP006]